MMVMISGMRTPLGPPESSTCHNSVLVCDTQTYKSHDDFKMALSERMYGFRFLFHVCRYVWIDLESVKCFVIQLNFNFIYFVMN